MSKSAKREVDRANQIYNRVQSDLSYVDAHSEELKQFMRSDQEEVRHLAVECFKEASLEYSLELRHIITDIMPRFDDPGAPVRINALAVGHNLANFWAYDLRSSTDLLLESAKSDIPQERYLAIVLIARIAIKRPDVVTPRKEILELLESIDYEELHAEAGIGGSDFETFSDAITALRGGDTHSRPLNNDLVPVGRATRLSKPARVGIFSLTAAVMTFLFPIIFLFALVRSMYRMDQYSVNQRARILINEVKRLKFFKNKNRAILYLRASVWPTPTTLLPFLPGKSPTSEDPTVRTGDYPPQWDKIAASVYLRDGYTCCNCEICALDEDVELHADHKKPRSRGGSDHPNNLRTLCRGCHEARHARVFER